MNRKWMVALGVVLLAAQVSVGEAPALKTKKEKLSYATGVDTEFDRSDPAGQPAIFKVT